MVDGGHSYKTRILVRKPSDPRRFNGTVVVEWTNVTGGRDLDVSWAESHEHLLRDGYVYVSVSVQSSGVSRLRAWSPARYGDLTVAADNIDPVTGKPLDLPNNLGAVDPIGWDIYSQIGQGLKASTQGRHADGARPLGTLKVQRMIATGESQSAGRMTTYVNTVHPMHRVYDGVVLYDRAGKLRNDLVSPLISVSTEFSARAIGAVASTSSPLVRYYEVAGSSHVALPGVSYLDRQTEQDQGLIGPNGPTTFTGLMGTCQDMPLWSRVDTGLVLDAAFSHVNTWLARGTRPPASALFSRDSAGALQLDAAGGVIGGVRLPDIEVPVAVNRGINAGPGFCILTGSHKDFSRSELEARYGNVDNYLAQVSQSLRRSVKAGYVLREDVPSALASSAAVYLRLSR